MKEVMGWGAILDFFELFEFQPYTMYSGEYKGTRLHIFGLMPDEFHTLLQVSEQMSDEDKNALPFWRWYAMEGPGQPQGFATKLDEPEDEVNVRGQHMVGWRRVTQGEPSIPRYGSIREYIEKELDIEYENNDEKVMIHSRLISDLAFHNSQVTAHYLEQYQGHREKLEPQW